MKLLLLIFALLVAISARAQQSAFNTIFLSKPNAQADRDYLGFFFTNLPPSSYGPHPPWVPLTNSSSTNLSGYVFRGGDLMYGPLTNKLAVDGFNLWLAAPTNIDIHFDLTTAFNQGDLSYDFNGFEFSDDVASSGSFFAGNGFYGDALNLTNFPGLSVTQQVVMWSGTLTNQSRWTNVYSGGLLVASGPFTAGHGPSWIWPPGGGYILWPGAGGNILLP